MIDDGDQPRPLGQGDEQPATTGPKTPSGERSFEAPRTETRRTTALMILGALVVVAVLAAALISQVARPSTLTTLRAGPLAEATPLTASDLPDIEQTQIVSPRPVSSEQLAALPQATTFGTTSAAPLDPAPDRAPAGKVARPAVAVPVFVEPGGEPIAVVPARQPLGIDPNVVQSDTWLSILDERPGWALVALPSRPNASVAWMFTDTPDVTISTTPYLITVDRAAFELTLSTDGAVTGRWKVGVGKPGAITPAGRTFLLAALRDEKSAFSKVVLPLGAHSDTHQTYGGGPGTVGVHTWPTTDVYGTASSDGCVRVPPEALQVLTDVPSGTPVLIK